jgi:mono/diheme cytochrome c family protein
MLETHPVLSPTSLNQQLLPTHFPAEGYPPKIAALILGVLALSASFLMGMYPFQKSDPYIDRVLARPGNLDQGHAIFQMNCASCHGIHADGKIGPSLKGVSSRRNNTFLIEQVTSGKTPPMPQFQPSIEEMADLLQYLNTL